MRRFIRRNADTGIVYRHAQDGILVPKLGGLARLEFHVDDHLALLSELKGIADQIDADLP